LGVVAKSSDISFHGFVFKGTKIVQSGKVYKDSVVESGSTQNGSEADRPGFSRAGPAFWLGPQVQN
jgi:hypothetical protein